MRVSARREDPGYSTKAYHCQVTVDGINVTNKCHTADEEKGIAWCNKLNANGQPYIENNAVAEEILHGKVKISFDEE